MTTRTIKVDYLARVEGEGALFIRLRGETAEEVQLRIFEPPRFFEALLRGRSQLEAPDITSRICGICPVAYQMSACHAIEAAHGVRVDPAVRVLRRLLYCGEWIESHLLHMVMLHAPDFFGFPDALTMAKSYPDEIKRGLRMKKAGNAIMTLLGGREIHPINIKVGGFYRAPSRSELQALLPELEWGVGAAEALLRWTAGFSYPDFRREYEFVALRHPDEYPMNEGRIVSSEGLDIATHDYDFHFTEEHVQHSNALQSQRNGRGAYLCGPLSRFNLNFDKLTPRARAASEDVGFVPPCTNPFKSILARAVETIHAFDEAARLVRSYEPPKTAAVDVPCASALGHGCTEAPRGILYHRYSIDGDGLITDAKIVPPTSQNQRCIEDDLRAMAPMLARLSPAAATARAEQAIRNYDPCISCAAHFLTLRIEQVEA